MCVCVCVCVYVCVYGYNNEYMNYQETVMCIQ